MNREKQKAIWVDEQLHKLIKLEATRKGKNIGEFVEEIISESLDSNCEFCVEESESEGGD